MPRITPNPAKQRGFSFDPFIDGKFHPRKLRPFPPADID